MSQIGSQFHAFPPSMPQAMPGLQGSKAEKMDHRRTTHPQGADSKLTGFVDVGVMPGLLSTVGHPVAGIPVPMSTMNQPMAQYDSQQRRSLDETAMQLRAMQLEAMRKQMAILQNQMMNMMSKMMEAHASKHKNQTGVFENAQPTASVQDKSEVLESDPEVLKAAVTSLETEIAELEEVLTDSKPSEETKNCVPSDDKSVPTPESFPVSCSDA